MMNWSAWLALAAQTEGPPPSPWPSMIMMFAMIGLAFWFIILRPQKREQAKRQQLLDNVAKGDKIVTIGGIHGKVIDAPKSGATLTIAVDNKVSLKINRSAVAVVERPDEEGASEPQAGK